MSKSGSKDSNINKRIKTPNYDANASRVKINKIIEEKNAERMRRKIKLVFTFIFLGILICTLYVVLRLPYFNVSKIEVLGNSFYSESDVKEASSVSLGKNIFLERFFGNVSVDLPYVDSVKVKMSLPSTIKLVITERESAYFAKDAENNTYYKIDINGYILEKKDDIKEKLESEMLVTGIAFSADLNLGTRLDDSYIAMLENFEIIRKKLSKSSIDMQITSVNFANSLTTITLDDKLSVKFKQDGDINYSISLLKAILDKLPEGSAGVIDMTKNDPIYSSY